MTFDERVTALAPLRFTPRQTRFLVTVALHSGYCLRRHYLAFAGIRYGKNVRDFFEALVRRELAQPLRYQANRGYLYHLNATAFYRALAQRDNRNRRAVSPAVIARKLMLLDYVLTQPEAEWYATEDDKVALFTHELGIPAGDLPRRVYEPADHRSRTTTRYFIHKLPVYRTPDRAAIHFVCLVTDASGRAFEQFLTDHVRLFTRLPAWSVVAVCPRGLNGLAACQAAFHRFDATTWHSTPQEKLEDVRWFFTIRRVVESGDLSRLSVADLDRFREGRQHFSTTQMEALYSAWLTSGERALEKRDESTAEFSPRTAELLHYQLSSTYSQFGSFPGVC